MVLDATKKLKTPMIRQKGENMGFQKEELLELLCAAINDCQTASLRQTEETLSNVMKQLENIWSELVPTNTRQYIVKASEEELGDEMCIVNVPATETDEEVKKNFLMASKYSRVCDFDDASDFDEHFEEMLEVRQTSGGPYTFEYYLMKHCHYEVKPLLYDFEYEW